MKRHIHLLVKNMKRCLIIVALLFLFSFNVSAEDLYSEQYEISGAESLYDDLSLSAKSFFEEYNIEPKNPNWVNQITAGNIFTKIFEFIKSGGAAPIKSGLQILGVIVLFAGANTFKGLKTYKTAMTYIFTLVMSASLLVPLFSLIDSLIGAIKGSSTFMLSFIPVYSGILIAGGQTATASGMSFLLLGAANIVSSIASFVIVPLMSCYLAIGLVSGVMPENSGVVLGDGIKKVAMWILSLTLTLFLGLLSIQTTVNAAADGLGLKALKFMVGSFVPVAGGALSESLATLTASVKLLKSSVGIYGVVALALTNIPIILELVLWRVVTFALSAVSELFGIKSGIPLLKAIDSVLAVLIGVVLFTAALFIISLTIVLK